MSRIDTIRKNILLLRREYDIMYMCLNMYTVRFAIYICLCRIKQKDKGS